MKNENINSQENKRKQIMEVAATYFMDEGYLKTSTRKIANKIGITQPNLYHYFPNKEALYVATLEDQLVMIGDEMNAICQQDGLKLEETLNQIALSLAQFKHVNMTLMYHDMEEYLSEENQQHLQKVWYEQMLEPLINLFDKNQTTNDFRFNHHQLAYFFLMQLSAVINFRNEQQIDVIINEWIQLFLYGSLN